jgi:MtN3 and saliva related transmembrane protein
MDKLVIEAIGLVAVMIGLASLVPQLVKTWRTRSAGDISLAWLVLQVVAYGFGFAYVLMLDAWASIFGHIVGGSLTVGLLLLKLRFDSRAAGRQLAAASNPPGAA